MITLLIFVFAGQLMIDLELMASTGACCTDCAKHAVSIVHTTCQHL